MENSILDSQVKKEPSIHDKLRRGAVNYRPLSDFTTEEYDDQFETAIPLDDYSLISEDNPLGTVTDSTASSNSRNNTGSWVRDWITTFMNSRDNINLMSERGKLDKDIMPTINDIDFELDVIDLKKQIQSLDTQLAKLDSTTQEYNATANYRNELQTKLTELTPIYEATLDKYGDKEGNDLDVRVEKLLKAKDYWSKEAQGVLDNIKDYNNSLDERAKDYQVTKEFQRKSQLAQDIKFSDIFTKDFWKYGAAGLAGSSFATAEAYGGSIASAYLAQLGKTAALRTATKFGGPVAAGIGELSANISALVGVAGTVASNWYSRHRESLAQVHGAYRSKVEKDLKDAYGVDINTLTSAARQLYSEQHPNHDLSKINDDQIVDMLVTGEIDLQDKNLRDVLTQSRKGLDNIYNNNMALSAMDVAETAMLFAPVGKVFKRVLNPVVRPFEKAAATVAKPVANKVNGVIDATMDLNRKWAYIKPPARIASKTAQDLGKIGFVALTEGYEEAEQDIFDYDYIHGKYDNKSAGIFNSLVNYGDAALRTTKILLGQNTNDDLGNDPQFWSDLWGGFALGLFMSGPVTAAQGGANAYSEFKANKYVRNVVADKIATDDDLLKTQLYTNKSVTNGRFNPNRQEQIIEVLEGLKNYPPEGVTVEDIDAEIKRAKDVMSTADSYAVKHLAKKIGVTPGTPEYEAYITLRVNGLNNLQEAVKNNEGLANKTRELYADATNAAELSVYPAEKREQFATLGRLNTQVSALDELIEGLGDADKAAVAMPEIIPEKIRKNNDHITRRLKTLKSQIETSRSALAAMLEVDPESVNLTSKEADGRRLYQQTALSDIDVADSSKAYNELLGMTVDGTGKTRWYNKLDDSSKKSVADKINKRISKYLQSLETNQESLDKAAAENETTIEVPKNQTTPEEPGEAQSGAVNIGTAREKESIFDPNADPDNDIKLGWEDEKTPESTPKTEEKVEEKPKNPRGRGSAAFDETVAEPTPVISEQEATPTESTKEPTKRNIRSRGGTSMEDAMPTEQKPVETKKPNPRGRGTQMPIETPIVNEEHKNVVPAEARIKIEEAPTNKVSLDEFDPKDLIVEPEIEEEPIDVSAEVSQPKDLSQLTPTRAEIGEEPLQQVEYSRQLIETTNKLAQLEDQPSDARNDVLQFSTDEALMANMGNSTLDKVSNTFFYAYYSDKPLDKKYKSGKELSVLLSNPKALEESSLEFDVVSWDGSYKPGKAETYDNAAVRLTVHHSTGDYVLSLKDPNGARILLNRNTNSSNLTGEELAQLEKRNEEAVKRLTDYRNAIIKSFENKKDGEVLVPSTIQRSNGSFSVNKQNGKSVQRPIQEVKGFDIPSDPYAVNPNTVTFGIGTGARGENKIMNKDNVAQPGRGGSGTLYIYPKASQTPSGVTTSNIQIQVSRFNNKVAKAILGLIIKKKASPIEYLTNAKGIETGLTAERLVNFLVRFGEKTMIKPNLKSKVPFLVGKQFNLDGDKLYVGNNVYDITNLSKQDVEDLTAFISNSMHWRIDKENIFKNINDALPEVEKYFANNPEAKELELFDGLTLTRDQFGMTEEHKTPMSTFGWYTANNLLTSDLNDQLFEAPFVYASGITTKAKTANVEQITPKQENISIKEVKKTNPRGKSNPFAFGDVFGDFGAPRLVTQVTQKMQAEEINWLRKKLGLTSDQIQVVDNLITLGKTGLQAMGLTKEDSIKLYSGAEVGTAYHEAFHRVSLLLLTPEERSNIYDAYRKKNKFKGTDNQVEEALAEDFRAWKLAKQPTNDYRITKFFRKLWSFISRFANLSNTTLDNIYDRIESGYFKDKNVNEESLNEFSKRYSEGAPFTFKGHKFKYITYSTFDEIVNTLVARLFNVNQVELADQLDNLDFSSLAEDLNPENVSQYEGITDNQKKVLQEVYENLENIFVPEVRQKIADYGINTLDSVEAQEERAEKLAEGEGVGDALAQHILSAIEISRKDTALASTKLFVATIPDAKFVEGKLSPLISSVTGMARFGDFNKNWNTILNNLHDCKTWDKLLNKVDSYSKDYPFFASLKWKLSKVKSEALQTQIINTIDSAYHNMVTVLAKQNGREVSVYLNDSNFNRAVKVYPQLWNSMLLDNDELFVIKGDKILPHKDDIDKVIDSYNTLADAVNKAVNSPNARIKGKDITYGEYITEEKLPDAKAHLLDILSKIGIDVDIETINDVISKHYPSDNPIIAFNNLLNSTKRGNLSSIFTRVLKSISDINIDPESNDYGIMTLNGKDANINGVYDRVEVVKQISEAYAMRNPNPEELTVLGVDGKLLYPISAHNYLSDMIQYLNTDPSYAKKMSDVMYNTGKNGLGSMLIKHVLNNGKLKFNTMVAFKKQNSSDTGRKYTGMSPLEDYIAKMTFVRNDHLILPTMGDSAMYNTISGMKLPHKHLLIDSNGKIMFDYSFLEQYVNYFLAELDTIETNYANESKINETNAVKNYHTGKRNGYRFRYFSGFFNSKNSKSELTNFNEALELAEKLDEENGTVAERKAVKSVLNQIRNQFDALSSTDKMKLMNNFVKQQFVKELKYAASLGLITFDGSNLNSIKNVLLDTEQFKASEKIYSHHSNPEVKKNARSYAAMDILADYFANTLISMEEFEKVFIKDPAYYKDHVDKIKRIREVLSTGTTPRTEFDPGNELNDFKEINVGTLSDNEIPSRQLDVIKNKATAAMTKQALLNSGMTEQEANATISSGEIPESIKKIVNEEVEANFGGYSEVNQTDATVLLSPEGYKQLVRRIDGWKEETQEAFDLLNDPNAEWENNPEKYQKALGVSLKPLKMMYFGDHYDADLKLDIPIFDKMALFPVHRIFAKGDLKKILERMERSDNPVHMLAFESAVKVGQRSKVAPYLDKENKVINQSGLDNMITYKQDFKFFRRQLITDPHHSPRQMFVSQAQKAMMGNLRPDRVYTAINGKQFTGDQIKENVTGALNALTAMGRQSVENTFGVEYDGNTYSIDYDKTSKLLLNDATNSGMNQNVIEGVSTKDGDFVAPLSGLSDNSWVESRFITSSNRDIIDVKTPGGMFIQMSSFTYNSIATDVEEGRKPYLNFANEDGSMDAVISINLLKHVIPEYDKLSFNEAKAWLINKNIIGENAKPAAIGYRIPAQGQSSTASLKIVDIYPEQIGDAITLPDEFTKLTGSDFDIDKLFLARFNYDRNGKLIEFKDQNPGESFEDYIRRQYEEETGAQAQDSVEGQAGDKILFDRWRENHQGDTVFEFNSKAANENRLLEMYMAVISNPDHFAETRVPLDTTTDYLKGTILEEVDTKSGVGKAEASSQLYYLTPQFQSRTKAELNGGKTGIGPFALNSAHHVLTQLTKIVFNPSATLTKYGLSSLDGIYGKDGKRILDWLSAMINAHVDVAKDPYIMRLNVVQWTYSMTNFLLRTGVGESTFYFLPQAILKDMASLIASKSGKFGVPDGMTRSQIEREAINEIFNTYLKKARKLAKTPQERAEIEVLRKINDNKTDLSKYPNNKSLDKDYLVKNLGKSETFEWYKNQLLIFSTFKELSPYAKDMSDLVNLSQIDTKKFGNNFGLQESFLYRLKSFLMNPNTLANPKDLFTETFLMQKIEDGLIFPRQAFSGIMLRTGETFATLRSRLFALTGGLGSKEDTYINGITRGMETAYKSAFFNKYLNENGINLKDMFFGENSIPKRLTQLKKEIKSNEKYADLRASDGTITNAILSQLTQKPKLTSTDLVMPDFIQFNAIRNAEGNVDNMMIRSWDELLDSDHVEIRKFAEDLAIYAYYTSGDNPGSSNIFKYVPNSFREKIGYFDFIRGIENDPQSLTQYISPEEFFENNWQNEDIVPTRELTRTRMDQYGENTETVPGIFTDINGNDVFVFNGEKMNYPLAFQDKFAYKSDSYGLNTSGQPVYPPYVKVKLDSSNPLGTLLYKYSALLDGKPIYVLTNKRSMYYQGSVLAEYGDSKSIIEANNVLESPITLDKLYKDTYNNQSYVEYQDFIKKFDPNLNEETDITYVTNYEIDDVALRTSPTDISYFTKQIQPEQVKTEQETNNTSDKQLKDEDTVSVENLKQVKIKVPGTNVKVERAKVLINTLKKAEAVEGQIDSTINSGNFLQDWNETKAVADLFNDPTFASDVNEILGSYIEKNPEQVGTDFSELTSDPRLSNILERIITDSGAFVKEDKNQLNLWNDSNEFPDTEMNHCK